MLLYTNPQSVQAGCECGHLPYTITLAFSGITEDSGVCLPKINGETVVLRTVSFTKLLVRGVIRNPWIPDWFFGGASGECIELDTSQYDGIPGPLPGLLPYTSGAGFAVLGRVPPPMSLFTYQGTGATFTPVFEESADFIGGLPAWTIGSVEVSDGGSGYIDGGAVTFLSGPGVLQARDGWNSLAPHAILRVRTREQPVVAASLPPPAGSDVTPATLAVSLSRNPGYPATWSVSSVEVLDGGAGYPKDQAVTFSVSSPGSQVRAATAVAHIGDGGVVQFVRLHGPGSYFRNEGRAVEVEVVEGGLYYGESLDIPAHVNPISIEVQQIAPSNGSGAEFDYTIDTNPYSATFGRITSVTLTNPGDGYTLLGGNGNWQVACQSGGAMVLELTRPLVECEGDGRNLNMRLTISGTDGWIVGPSISFGATFQGEGPVVDAADLPEQLEGVGGTAGTVTLTPGGRYLGPQGPCCSSCPADRGNMDSVESITVTVQLAYPPCDVNTTVALTLDRSDLQAFWQASQEVGDMRVSSSFGAFAGFYSLQVDVWLCTELGGLVPVTRYFRMEAMRLDGECVPVGFDEWAWLPAAEGQQNVVWVPGNELPPEFPGLAVSVSASVVFA